MCGGPSGRRYRSGYIVISEGARFLRNAPVEEQERASLRVVLTGRRCGNAKLSRDCKERLSRKTTLAAN